MKRWLQNLFALPFVARLRFDARVLADIEAAIATLERAHAGELRFVVENALDFAQLRAGCTARARALEQFGLQGVWDTEGNNGVLIYVLLAEQRVEIIADRGIAARVEQSEWDAVCRRVESEYRAGRFREGSIAAVTGVGELLERHFPAAAGDRNEQPDRPILL